MPEDNYKKEALLKKRIEEEIKKEPSAEPPYKLLDLKFTGPKKWATAGRFVGLNAK